MFLLILAIIIFVAGIVVSGMMMSNIRSNKKKMTILENEIGQMSISDDYGRRRNAERMEELRETNQKTGKYARLIQIGSFILAVIFVLLSMITVVPTGYTGIKTTFGKVENDTLPSGINFKLPWQAVITMDNREQRAPFTLQAFSKDIQQVDIQGSINLNIDKTTAMNLYREVGVGYWDILITPRVYEDVKIIIAKYTAEKLVENRQACSDQIYELLKTELAEKGINVISFAIENIDFTDAFESAVEAKQVATQEKQKAQTEQERQTMEMQQKAERDRIQAQAEADVQKIDADAKAYAVKVQAEAQAEANKKLAETLSEPLIRYNMIHTWDGKLPIVQSSGSGLNLIDIQGMLNDQPETEEK